MYGRKYEVWNAACKRRATALTGQAMVAAAGWPAMTSRARFGPDNTATRPAGTSATSLMTSLARIPVPASIPFIADTITVPCAMLGAHNVRLALRDCAGMERTR